ncbi:4Fe-4S binding protein [bacterium]|nr:4Fe-4S binding protein [bacterium]
MKIAIGSGKGGTGKTSITACFAHLAESAVLADCDVDAADLHLLLDPKVKDRGEFKAGKVAILDKDMCTLCGACFNHCRFDAVKMKDEVYYIDEISCEGCKVCEIVCPPKAIRMEEKVSGDWYVADSKKHPAVKSKEIIKAPPHEPGLLPKWLAEMGANVIIAGGMGSRAQGLFAEKNITVVVGAKEGTPEEIVTAYLNDALATGDNICDH